MCLAASVGTYFFTATTEVWSGLHVETQPSSSPILLQGPDAVFQTLRTIQRKQSPYLVFLRRWLCQAQALKFHTLAHTSFKTCGSPPLIPDLNCLLFNFSTITTLWVIFSFYFFSTINPCHKVFGIYTFSNNQHEKQCGCALVTRTTCPCNNVCN